MTDRTFVDTNVWVHAVDSADPAKQARARTILAPGPDVDLVVSSKVLAEFYVVVTRREPSANNRPHSTGRVRRGRRG